MERNRFRSWNTKTQIMTNADKLMAIGRFALSQTLHNDSFLVLPMQEQFKLMQTTGKFDVNNTEIFEGDIVKGTKDNKHIGQSEVFLGDNFDLQPFSYLNCWDMNKFEVIGNIYEDPELIEQIEEIENV